MRTRRGASCQTVTRRQTMVGMRPVGSALRCTTSQQPLPREQLRRVLYDTERESLLRRCRPRQSPVFTHGTRYGSAGLLLRLPARAARESFALWWVDDGDCLLFPVQI